MFLAVNAALMIGDRIAYGSLIDTDLNEANFVAALDALQSIDTGPIIPYEPVPAASRAEAAKVSPTFRPLAAMLAPGKPLAEAWGLPGCQNFKEACGDIGGGWFMFALRDAAAGNGFYQSPRIAAQKFGQIAKEITTACGDGRLRCRHIWVSFLPPKTWRQWRLALPPLLLAQGKLVAFIEPDSGFAGPSPTNSDQFKRYWSFLNYPRIIYGTRWVTANGWYYDRQSTEWPVFEIYAENGKAVSSKVIRTASPDLQKAFSDANAAMDRWTIKFNCPARCVLVARVDKRPELRLPMMSGESTSVTQGSATLYLDSAAYADPDSKPGLFIAERAQTLLFSLYRAVTPFLVGVGFLTAFVALIRSRSIGASPGSDRFLVALAAWLLVVTRVGLFALIAASVSSSVVNPLYSIPANYLALLAAILSFAALAYSGRTRGSSRHIEGGC